MSRYIIDIYNRCMIDHDLLRPGLRVPGVEVAGDGVVIHLGEGDAEDAAVLGPDQP